METDLCMLPSLVAEKRDAILTPQGITDIYGRRVESVSSLVPVPWGWNKSVRNRFIKLGLNPEMMPSEAELDLWRTFSSRKWAVEYNKQLYDTIGEENYLVNNEMEFCSSTENIMHWLSSHSAHPYILKSEYSSSGRGNRIDICGKANLPTLHATNVLVDRFYNKSVDFAMEFRIMADKVEYMGLSVFEASNEGKYLFNYLGSQQKLKGMICRHFKNNGERILEYIADIHKQLLAECLIGKYHGMAGIDMLVTDNGKLHPCVEINFRMNMGILSILLYEKGIKQVSPSLRAGKRFRPVIDSNKFYIDIKESESH